MTQQTSQNSGFSHIIGGNEDQFLPHNHVSLRKQVHIHENTCTQCMFGNMGV